MQKGNFNWAVWEPDINLSKQVLLYAQDRGLLIGWTNQPAHQGITNTITYLFTFSLDI